MSGSRYIVAMGTGTDLLLARLRRVLERYPAIRAAYLFGSRTRGQANAGSDVDVGLVGPPEVLLALKLDMLAELTAQGIERVDLVLLDSADPVLRFEVVRPNRLVLARPDFDHGEYFSRTLREYQDLEPYLSIQRNAFRRRLQRGEV